MGQTTTARPQGSVDQADLAGAAVIRRHRLWARLLSPRTCLISSSPQANMLADLFQGSDSRFCLLTHPIPNIFRCVLPNRGWCAPVSVIDGPRYPFVIHPW